MLDQYPSVEARDVDVVESKPRRQGRSIGTKCDGDRTGRTPWTDELDPFHPIGGVSVLLRTCFRYDEDATWVVRANLPPREIKHRTGAQQRRSGGIQPKRTGQTRKTT